MIASLVGSTLVLVTWLSALVVMCGIGFLALRLVGLSWVDGHVVSSAFWLGWSSIVMVLQIWHLFHPVNLALVAFLAVLGSAGILLALAEFRRPLAAYILSHPSFVGMQVTAFLLFGLWLANRATGPLTPYDAGLYHLGAIGWIRACPIVPGLGNLHGRLAFNSSHFLFLSLLDVTPWIQRGQHLGNGVLLLGVAIQLGQYLLKAVVGQSSLRGYEAFGIVLAAPVVDFCFTSASGTSVDLPVFILGVVIGVRLFRVLLCQESDRDILSDVAVVVILSAVGISLKLSFAVFGCLSSLVAAWALTARKKTGNLAVDRKPLVRTLAAATLVLVPWMARGVILSGYPAYPISYPSFELPWRVPKTQAVSDARWIASWARQPHESPDEVLQNWTWITPWLRRAGERWMFEGVLPVLLLIPGIPGALVAATRDRRLPTLRTLMFLMVPIVSLALWFLTAPDIRFAGACLWLLGGGVTMLSVRLCDPTFQEKVIRTMLFLVLLVFATKAVDEGLFVPAGPDDGFHRIPSAQTDEFVTDSGLRVQAPKSGDQCWDACLPCTPYPKPDLRLIEETEICSGFTVQDP